MPDPQINPLHRIIHVDMDAFFASVECLDRPELVGRPIVVGGRPESRGVVAAASYKARRYGIHSAMSSWRALKLCPELVFLRPRLRRYQEVSRHIFRIFGAYTDRFEPISIDEAFLDVTGSHRLFGPAERIGRTIKERIQREVGLIASVGVAPNKFLAKLASDLEKPDGFVAIQADEVERVLGPLPVDRLWGVGPATTRILERLGIRRVRDLWDYPAGSLGRVMGVAAAESLLRLAHGLDERPVRPPSENKSIGAEETFAHDLTDPASLAIQVRKLVDRVARRLRRRRLSTRTVTLKIRDAHFHTVTRTRTLRVPTAATLSIRAAALDLLEQYLLGHRGPFRLLGVAISNLEPEGQGQGDLFMDNQDTSAIDIDRLIDDLQDRYGPEMIGRG